MSASGRRSKVGGISATPMIEDTREFGVEPPVGALMRVRAAII